MDSWERAYLSDQYRMNFTSRVRLVEEADKSNSRVYLEKTYFYPVSGGQPDDRGSLGGNSVLAVNEDSKGVSHLIEGRLKEGEDVEGVIEKERRYDHMRQHSGQHLLSRVFLDILDLETVGFHIGESASTIDLDGKMPSAENFKTIELEVNKLIMKNIAISVNTVSPGEYNRLRADSNSKCPSCSKISEKTEDIRLVEIEGVDVNPCCGTHVANTGEIGIIKITGIKRVNKNSRIEFLCGMRGMRDYIEKDLLLNSIALSFSTGWKEVGNIACKLSDENAKLRVENKTLNDKLNDYRARQLAVPDSSVGGFSIVKKIVEDAEVSDLRNLAGEIRKNNDIIILLGSLKPKPAIVFACSEGVPLSMGSVLKESASVMGAGGGGGEDFAQGGGGNGDLLRGALDKAEELVRKGLGQ
ncbi:MAG: DHHA1 domain-containing protein [Candidatus Krumholzibacteriota bacterium]|nr:DHHA1 domain-containing protein [Candidatus Krumholzibacteriota bacterium]